MILVMRERVSHTEEREPPSAAPASTAAPLLALQRSAGNAATAAWVQRQIRFREYKKPPAPAQDRQEVLTWLGANALNARQLEELDAMMAERAPHDYSRDNGQRALVRDINDRIAVAEVAALMARKRTADYVIVQGDYQSGDRYGIASAIVAARDLGVRILVLIAHAPGSTDAADELAGFYRTSAGGDAGVADLLPVNAPAVFYRTFRTLHPRDKRIKTATYGTEFIKMASNFVKGQEDITAGARKIQSVLVANWRGKAEAKEKDLALLEWLAGSIGLVPGRYAFLWVKTGAMSAEKSHHFTNPTAWRKLVDRVRDETKRVPVLVGEDIGFRTDPHLGAFWKHEKYPAAVKAEGRIGQLRLFSLLAASHDYDVVNVGMRSGAIEGPALVGLPTIYLEESGNPQSERMEKWLRALPNYFRVIIDRPPGGAHLRAWIRDTLDDARRRLRDPSTSEQERRRLAQWIESGAEEALPMSLYEGLAQDESDAIIALLKRPAKDLKAEHDRLGMQRGRYRFENRPGDATPPFSEKGRDRADNVPVRIYGDFKTWLRAARTRGTRQNVPAVACIGQLTGLFGRVKPNSRAADWEAIALELGQARGCFLTGRDALLNAQLGAGLRAARDTFLQAAVGLSSRRRQAIRQDVEAWFAETQPGFRLPAANAGALLAQLIGLLENPPADRAAADTKWTAIGALLPQLTAADMPGAAALLDEDLGARLHELAAVMFDEVLAVDLLPPGAPPPAPVQAPVTTPALTAVGSN